MPHADTALIPSEITSKKEFWEYIHSQLASLLEGQRNWVTNLSNASSLIYNSLLAFPSHFGSQEKHVNWCGFYLESSLFPPTSSPTKPKPYKTLLLGPFNGKPACQYIRAESGKGVCADAYVHERAVLVPDVEKHPGHIACDGDTKSELVIPLIVQRGAEKIAVGVLDLDCVALEGFGLEDVEGLQKIVDLIVGSCDWNKFSS